MRIATFDLGSNIAVAHNLKGTDDVRVASQHFPGDRPARLAATQAWLQEFFDQAGPMDAVMYERPFARGMHATRSLWGVAGLIEAAAAARDIPVLDVTPGEIKKFAAGKGDASKDDMILMASLTGYLGDNEHEADAWCLLRYAEADLKPQRTKKKGKTRG